MAKVVLICPKPGTANPYDAATVERLARRLAPDIITPRPPLVSEPHGVLTALLNGLRVTEPYPIIVWVSR